MNYPIYNQQGEKTGEKEMNPAVFEVAVNEDLVHQVIVAQDANARVVLAHTKQRADVRGGGRKPWRQKGTGRARHGSIRSPLWRGGGVTFGPTKSRNFSKKVNKKMKQKALFMVLSDKLADKRIILLDELSIPEVKTKKFVEVMNTLFTTLNENTQSVKTENTKTSASAETSNFVKTSSDESANKQKAQKDSTAFDIKTLIITPKTDEILIKSSNNIQKVKVIRADSLNVKDILNYDWLVVFVKSLDVIGSTYLK